MPNNPIHLTILRRGDTHIVDLAEVQAIIPRSETRVDGAFLEEISQEIKRITNLVGPEFRKAAQKLEPEAARNPHIVKELKNLGSLIFSHLMPEAAREKLRAAETCNLYLRLDDQLVHIPWELAFDGQQFLGMKFRVGRQIITRHKVAQPTPTKASSGILKVLIISDPSETLKNVSRESEQLCGILDQVSGLDVKLLGGRGVKRIPLLAALRESDMVHFAGHSQFDEKNPENSGWLLHDGLLSASEISKLDQTPSLVFSNSCQAGATKNWQSDYLFEGEAFGLGSAFLLSGVRNYVGTFCVVHDEESRFLAVEFYRRLARGSSIGQALLEARVATAEEMGLDRLTWASYMLYGDPGFSPIVSQLSVPNSSSLPKSENVRNEHVLVASAKQLSQTTVLRHSEPGPNHSFLGWLSASLLGAILVGFLLVSWWAPGKDNTLVTSSDGSSIEDKPVVQPPTNSEATTFRSEVKPKLSTKTAPDNVLSASSQTRSPPQTTRHGTSETGSASVPMDRPTVPAPNDPRPAEPYIPSVPKAFRDVGNFRFEVDSLSASTNTNTVVTILDITNRSSREVAFALGDKPNQSAFLMDQRGFRYSYRSASGIGVWKGPFMQPTLSDWLVIPAQESRILSITFESGTRNVADSNTSFVLSVEMVTAAPEDTRKTAIRPSIMNVSIANIVPWSGPRSSAREQGGGEKRGRQGVEVGYGDTRRSDAPRSPPPPGYSDVEIYKIASAAFRSELVNKQVRVLADMFVPAYQVFLPPDLASKVVPLNIYQFSKSMAFATALIPKAMVEELLEQRKGRLVSLYGRLVGSGNGLVLMVQSFE